MPHCLLDGDQVGAGFIEMKSESVTKAMEIEAAVSEAGLVKMADEDVIDRLLTDMGVLLLPGKQPVLRPGAAISRPDIRYQESICLVGKHSIAIRTVLAAGDVDAVPGTYDIAAVQAAELTDTYAGRIEECNLSFMLRIGNRIDDSIDLLLCRDVRKKLVEVKVGDFPLVPVLV
jgi:hypothetical protein